jgi:inner membrane protein involved in colicin E2 resistance
LITQLLPLLLLLLLLLLPLLLVLLLLLLTGERGSCASKACIIFLGFTPSRQAVKSPLVRSMVPLQLQLQVQMLLRLRLR